MPLSALLACTFHRVCCQVLWCVLPCIPVSFLQCACGEEQPADSAAQHQLQGGGQGELLGTTMHALFQDLPSLAIGCGLAHRAHSNSFARALKTGTLMQTIMCTPALLCCVPGSRLPWCCVCWLALPASCAVWWQRQCDCHDTHSVKHPTLCARLCFLLLLTDHHCQGWSDGAVHTGTHHSHRCQRPAEHLLHSALEPGECELYTSKLADNSRHFHAANLYANHDRGSSLPCIRGWWGIYVLTCVPCAHRAVLAVLC